MSQSGRVRLTLLVLVLGALAVSQAVTRAQPSPKPLPNPYRVDEAFALEMPPGLKTLGATVGAKIGPDGNLYVFHRCVARLCAGHPTVPPLLKYTLSGKLLLSWGQGMFVWPHALYVAADGSVWVTDAGRPPDMLAKYPDAKGKGHQVFKFSPDGRLLMTLGKGAIPGRSPDTFSAPSDVVIGRNGDIFVADGHRGAEGHREGNTRVVKFTKDGKYIKEWGTEGSGPGQFIEPHGLAIDSKGRLFVSDRPNNRIQIFDQDGKFLEEWKHVGEVTFIYIDKNDLMYFPDDTPGSKKGVYIGSAKDGKLSGFIPKVLEKSNIEGIGGSPDGSVLYETDIELDRIVKFIRK